MTTNLFEQFSGADFDRLSDCLKAIRQAGLSTTKYTQAGVNQSSGNVWVCDEDWAGCVACSIGFDVSWYHSCPECGAEYEFDTYRELQDYIEEHDGQCEACKPEEDEDEDDSMYTVYTLPAHWASALINDDRTGLTDEEEFLLDEWLESEAPGFCVGCSDEAEFRSSNDAGTLAGDCLDFTFQKAE